MHRSSFVFLYTRTISPTHTIFNMKHVKSGLNNIHQLQDIRITFTGTRECADRQIHKCFSTSLESVQYIEHKVSISSDSEKIKF